MGRYLAAARSSGGGQGQFLEVPPWYVHVGERRYIDASGHLAALGFDPTADQIQARADYLLHATWPITPPINYVRAFFD